jgi:hypothetical protein
MHSVIPCLIPLTIELFFVINRCIFHLFHKFNGNFPFQIICALKLDKNRVFKLFAFVVEKNILFVMKLIMEQLFTLSIHPSYYCQDTSECKQESDFLLNLLNHHIIQILLLFLKNINAISIYY